MTWNRALAALCFAAAAGVAVALDAWTGGPFTMDARKWQPAPAGHTIGKDDPAGAPDASHHPGDDCGICHAPAASATAPYQPMARGRVFTITGTVFDGRAARRPVAGAEVVLEDAAGNVLSVTSNDLGNFFTEAPLSPDPAVAAPLLPDGSDAWRYKAWVKSEGGVRPMMTMPAVGGMTVPRMSCSMHHVNSGTVMAAWASPRATLRSYPSAGLSYRRHVFPILRTKCGPCHVPGPTEAAQGGETFDYGAGLDLMTYAGSEVVIHDSTGGSRTWAKFGVRTVVNTDVPEASLLFAKTLVGGTHGGGAFWTVDSPDYRALRTWIAEGAQDN